jgi:hypothetical protein
MNGHLYRGVSEEMHQRLGGVLQPKVNRPFVAEPEFGRAEYGNAYWGENEANAVIEHQQHQAGFPTSGVSTTPHLERAQFYATAGGHHPRGYVYVIDRARLAQLGVKEFVVNEIVPMPSIPEDSEVILVAADLGPLPAESVIEVVLCGT